jgi:putative Mg2+ transporter-C (MgtC) family protein
MTYDELIFLVQALLAVLLGGLLGWERESAGKWAGLRTHMLVCLACMMFIRIGHYLVIDAQKELDDSTLQMDPVRLVEAIVTGVAFLGAGTIFRDPEREFMRGLTTAASLLAVAPIGIAVGVSRYVLAIALTLIVLFVLRAVKWWEVKARPGADAGRRETQRKD